MLQYNKTDIERLSDIYIVSNTPYFLYKKFRDDPFVKELGNLPINQIINEFIELGGKEIEGIGDLALAYALYISLTFKDYEQVSTFFNNKGNIGFEWFPDIKSIFISSYVPSTVINISGKDLKILPIISNIENFNSTAFGDYANSSVIEIDLKSK